MEFENKIIYIISYEDWGEMLMSKHHYAIELGKMGNKVYFINHTDKRYRLKRGEIQVSETIYLNVWSVTHRISYPYILKYKFKNIYNFLTRFHIKKLVKKIGEKPDIVWSFEMGNALPIKYFTDSNVKIYMPVDGPFGTVDEEKAIQKADILISVTNKILEQYKKSGIPKLRINHGVSDVFISGGITYQQKNPIKIGYSGSLVRSDLDIDSFTQIIESHPEKIFEFWGEYDFNKSNIHLPQDVQQQTLKFIESLKNYRNVILHGPVNPIILAAGLQKMDALLISYNIRNDQNHHKVLEYLGSGKVIVSSYMSSYYNEDPDLIEMVRNTHDNKDLQPIFNKVINNLSFYNSLELQNKRLEFAKKFTYKNQIITIQNFLNKEIKYSTLN